MRCAISLFLLLLLWTRAGADVRDVMVEAVDDQGQHLRAEVYLKRDGFELLGPSGRAYEVEVDPFVLPKADYIPLKLGLVHPDYIGLYEEVEFRPGVPIQVTMVPRRRRFLLQTDPPQARVESEQGFIERASNGSIELDPTDYLPLAGRAGGQPLYQRAPTELTVEADGYETTTVTITPEQWRSGQLGSVELPAARGLSAWLTRLRRSPGLVLLALMVV
ncbi:MAG: hypothetical protein KC910_10450, partial [Candidatus Eremiobacteraeota bacterium]|nr:hypothetical protein [Candidatus Eremiobacteraeota bacterium]